MVSVYLTCVERPQSQGRVDCIVETPKYYTFYLILRMVSVYLTCVEKPQSQGRVDCIVETPKYVYIFEFKLDGTADEALAQIEAKGYARPYAADSRTVHCVGVSFSSETGTIGEWKSLLLK